VDAARAGGLSPGRRLVPSPAGRRHLDGALLPAVVRGDGQATRALPLLQGREPRPDGGAAGMTLPRPEVDIGRVMAGLEALARATDAEPPAVTRILYTDADRAGRALINGLCAEAGLALREDPIGNTFARWEGSRPELPAVGTGSHIDAIPHSGRFDGTIGVLG